MTDFHLPTAGATTRVPLRFSQSDFDQFARLSGDDNPIHVDPVFAASTRFGATVAHGMLLFAASVAAINRWVGGSLTLHEQELMFPAPTFADLDLTLELAVQPVDNPARRRIAVELHGPAGPTCRAAALVGFDSPVPDQASSPAAASEAKGLAGMRLGQQAGRERTLSADDVAALIEMVDDPHPLLQGDHPLVPPALLGGLISDLLGTSLPGPGTNWLKQRYRFHRPVPAGTSVLATVTVSRLRPAKQLVNLNTLCETDAGTVLTGEALVLVSDTAASDGEYPG